MNKETEDILKEEGRLYGWTCGDDIKHSESWIAGAARGYEIGEEKQIKITQDWMLAEYVSVRRMVLKDHRDAPPLEQFKLSKS